MATVFQEKVSDASSGRWSPLIALVEFVACRRAASAVRGTSPSLPRGNSPPFWHTPLVRRRLAAPAAIC